MNMILETTTMTATIMPQNKNINTITMVLRKNYENLQGNIHIGYKALQENKRKIYLPK